MSTASAAATRRIAIDALVRIDEDAAYANLVLPHALERSQLDSRDRAFVTDLVYGTTRMRRACDHLVDRFLITPVEPRVRAALRVGAYQLAFAAVPAHAAVDATVGAVHKRVRGLVNAVLRRVNDNPLGPDDWPSDATRLSYPDWIVARLVGDLGHSDALAALTTMNLPPVVTVRDDGYRQDPSSQLVAELVNARPAMVVADVCAAPGGKSTALASSGAYVVASDVSVGRLGLVTANRATLGLRDNLSVVAADARRAPYRPDACARVLVDAPCSGLGALCRRPDARWRITADAVDRLAQLQIEIMHEAARLVARGGEVVYSVCTLTNAESLDVDAAIEAAHTDLVALDEFTEPWQHHGRGARILPQSIGSDGMCAFHYRKR